MEGMGVVASGIRKKKVQTGKGALGIRQQDTCMHKKNRRIKTGRREQKGVSTDAGDSERNRAREPGSL